MSNILVCPDLHGRSWLLDKAINIFNKENLPICFLGDYLDCYQNEFKNYTDSSKETIEVFKELIQFAKERPDDVTLLLGDHELQYTGLSNSLARFDYNHAHYIYNFLKENESLFTGAFIYNNTLFTHAGVSEGWLKTWDLSNNPEMIRDYINNSIKFSDHFKQPSYFDLGDSTNPCFDIGRSRGGYASYGGPFWADVEEMIRGKAAFNGQINQIFAHTQLRDTGTFIHRDNWWMCDSRAVFIWDGKELKLYN